ncbi:NAD-P-binding protein [Coprinopsis marcescibilis]|uniref:NAD-P-binding protein n=1 Tax=Coprinopsis marcescibilis TaxID=230819 RepID=A0A5C3L2H7_COPMA|nr:NAD-P-binding protein [Coprinopsis marcescibilis]
MHSSHLSISTHIFLTGATGYLGGSILTRLLSHPLSETFRLTVLVRAPEKATQFRKMGIHAVEGSNTDLELVRKLASNADIVVACTDADDLEAAKAILEGLKERNKATNRVPSLIHTVSSGTGVLIDDARGMHASDKIYEDLDISALAAIPRTQPHREVDLQIIDADNEGYVKTYIVLPSLIYGRASGPLVDAGLQNPRSQIIPQLVHAAISRGRAGVLGKGANICSNVHIAELTSLYILLIDLIIASEELNHDELGKSSTRGRSPLPGSRPRTPVVLDPSAFTHGRSGYYFAENGEHTMLSVSEAIGKAMVDLGHATDPEPSEFTEAEKKKYFPVSKYLETNARCRAERARLLGWKPKKTTKDMLASIKSEIKFAAD